MNAKEKSLPPGVYCFASPGNDLDLGEVNDRGASACTCCGTPILVPEPLLKHFPDLREALCEICASGLLEVIFQPRFGSYQ